jgi:hypothetical protein
MTKRKGEFHATELQGCWLSKYAQAAANPLGWELSAKHLKESADLIFDYFRPVLESAGPSDAEKERLVNTLNLLGSYYLLAALALENLLKGILVEDRPQYVREDGWKGPRHHDLSKLCKEAKLMDELSPRQKTVIERLTGYLVWAGRYPLFVNEKDLFDADGTEETPLTMGPIENEVIDEMFADFEKCLFAQVRKHAHRLGRVPCNSIELTPNGKVILHRAKH